ncbi:MAG TPA: GNAT family N-acetyltransferase [Caulobacteraceae bacterium]|jgi:RimJ/RimL family protein N-acetyltransferase
MELITERLRLRRAREGDLAAMHAVLSNAEAMRYWSTPPHQSLDQTREWLAGMIADGPPGSDDFVVEHQGRVIGKAGCWRLPEIGFILHEDRWGQGLAGEAAGAVIAHVFTAHDLPAITADVDPRNTASLRLLARLGFVETGRAKGTFEIGGELCDSVYLALARPAAR